MTAQLALLIDAVACTPKFVPLIVIVVPPAVGPDAGLTLVIDGGPKEYVTLFDTWPPVVTRTGKPVPWPDAVQMICVALCSETGQSTVPTVTVLPLVAKPLPLIVIGVPEVAPFCGAIDVIVGAAYEIDQVFEVWPATVMIIGRLVPVPAGAVHTTCVCVCDSSPHVCPPIVTLPLVPKLVPLIVSTVPPAVCIAAGETPVIVGAEYE
jgi:hypothetical protein